MRVELVVGIGLLAATASAEVRVSLGRGWVEFDDARYAISLDGEQVADRGVADRSLRLRYAEFDPLSGEPAVPAGLEVGAGQWIVQFQTPLVDAYRAKVSALGERSPIYLPANSLIVRLGASEAKALAAWAPVRWVGPYRAAYRLEPELLTEVRRGRLGARRVVVQLFERSSYLRSSVASRISLIGGRVENVPSDGYWIEATLDAARLLEVARWPEVVWIDRWQAPETDMDVARQIGGALALETEQGLAGAGVRGEVMDTNVRDTHNDFDSRPLIIHGSRSGSTFHGTSVAGIVFGDGAVNPLGRGMLPLGQGIFADFELLTDRYRHTRELKEDPYRAVFQTNSWGSGLSTDYTSVSAQMDDIILQNDILICQSQSNQGSRSSRPQAWAKNIVSVGGISHRNTLTKSDDAWTSASYGPAADGRLKPDLSHFYDSIFTVAETSDTAYTTDFGGTSGATPIIAGHFGLFYEMWAKGLFGNSVRGATVFDAAPKFTLAKAFVVNTASAYPFSGRNANLGRYRQGWGLADVGQLFAARNLALFVNESDVLLPLERKTYRVHVPAGQPWIRASMTYADLPGTTSATQHRINKLNLKVTAPDGTVYWGNNGLADANASTPGGSPNNVDTLENVFVANPAAGTWTIEVWARELNLDGRVETPGVVDADFSLVVTGVAYAFPAASVVATEGEVVSGDVGSTVLSDEGRLTLQNVKAETAEIEASFALPHRLADRIGIRVESRSDAQGAEVTLKALNLSTGALEAIGTAQVGAADGVAEFEIQRARRFVDTQGRAKLRLAWRRTDGQIPVQVSIDQVRAFFTPMAGIQGVGR